MPPSSLSHSKQKCYNTHHVNERPFHVCVSQADRCVKVYSATFYLNEKDEFLAHKDIKYDVLLLTIKPYKNLFIGYDRGPWWKGNHDHSGDGNTVLVQDNKNQYTFIGRRLYTFVVAPGDQIVEYYSNMRESDISEPVALGKRNVYFPRLRVYLPLATFKGIDNWAEVYRVHHGYGDILAPREKYMKIKKEIKIDTWAGHHDDSPFIPDSNPTPQSVRVKRDKLFAKPIGPMRPVKGPKHPKQNIQSKSKKNVRKNTKK